MIRNRLVLFVVLPVLMLVLPGLAQAQVADSYSGAGTVSANAPAADRPWPAPYANYVEGYVWYTGYGWYYGDRQVGDSVQIAPSPWSGWTWTESTLTSGDWVLMHTADLDGVAAAAATTPLFQLYKATTGDHYYTISTTSRDSAIKNDGYALESNEGYVFSTLQTGTVPMYGLYNKTTGDHFYTSSSAEMKAAEAGGYSEASTYFYDYPTSQGSATEPLYRLYSTTLQDHYYTVVAANVISAETKSGYRYEGIAGYVRTSAS